MCILLYFWANKMMTMMMIVIIEEITFLAIESVNL